MWFVVPGSEETVAVPDCAGMTYDAAWARLRRKLADEGREPTPAIRIVGVTTLRRGTLLEDPGTRWAATDVVPPGTVVAVPIIAEAV